MFKLHSRRTMYVSLTALALCAAGAAIGDPLPPSSNSAQMQALTRSAIMQKAMSAARAGDARTAAIYFREAAQQGNLLAQASISRLYFEGRGVPRDYGESLKWAKLVLMKKQEPTYSMALATLRDIIDAAKRSPNEKDRIAGVAAAVLPLASMLPAHMRGGRAAGHADQEEDALGDYLGRKLLNEMTDHEYENPIFNPAD